MTNVLNNWDDLERSLRHDSFVLIYGLYDPRDEDLTVRYVGKTTNLRRRLYQHVFYAKHGVDTHCARWIHQLLAEGVIPAVRVLELCRVIEWESAEKRWISSLPNLTNIARGGNGVAFSRLYCRRGLHPLTPDNVIIRRKNGVPSRLCKQCRETAYHAERQVVIANRTPRTLPSECLRGHPLNGSNLTFIKKPYADGTIRDVRRCRACDRLRGAAVRRRRGCRPLPERNLAHAI